MTSYEDKLRSFALYVKEQMKGLVPLELLEGISDEDLMDAGRKNPETGTDFFSKEQERHIIMETSTNEAIYNTLANLKHLSHIEGQEKKLLDEFLAEVKPISILNNEQIVALMKRFEKYTKNIKIEDVDKTVFIICSMFPHWILEGNKFDIYEEKPLEYAMHNEGVCMGCLLDETLHKFKTFFGWAKHSNTGDILEDKKNGEQIPETFELKAKDSLIDLLTALFTVRFDTALGFLNSIEKNRSFSNLFYDLCEALWTHIMSTSLISCWVHGKEYAQKSLLQKEEAKELLEGIHKRFVGEFQNCEKSNSYTSFLQNVKDYLRQFDKTQLVLLSHYGFPFRMPRVIRTRIEKIILKELKAKAEDN